MKDELQGRVCVVAGASSGIGLTVARRFHAAGAVVYALARSEIKSDGDGYRPMRLDVTDRSAVEQTLTEIAKQHPIDILVYVAGYNVPKRRIADLDVADWDAIVRVNLDGAFYTLKSALPSLRTSKGLAIFISSASASWPNFSGAAYQASKTGLFGLSRAAAYEEHDKSGVRFSVILPGIVDTPHLDRRPQPPTVALRKLMLKSEDVASACLFLATLPARAYVPELHILPTALQAPGKT